MMAFALDWCSTGIVACFTWLEQMFSAVSGSREVIMAAFFVSMSFAVLLTPFARGRLHSGSSDRGGKRQKGDADK